MSNRFFARPVVPILIALMAGIVLGDRYPGWKLGAIAAVGLILFWLGFMLWRNRSATIGPLLLFIAIGYSFIQPWSAPSFPSHHLIHYADNQKTAASGTIVEAPLKRPNGLRVIMDVVRIHGREGDLAVSGRLLVSIGPDDQLDLSRGDRIRVSGRLRRVAGFHNPGGFNYERYLAFQRIWCHMWVAPERVQLLQRSDLTTFAGGVDNLRRAVANRIDTTVDGESGRVLKALVIGDRTGLPLQLKEAFNRTGTGHLLAIPGLHIGIVATVAFFLFKWLLSFNKRLLRRAWVGKVAAVFTFVPVICYGIMAGMSPSTQRAVVMVALFLLAYLVGKLHDPLNILAVAGLAILSVHPPALFSISFQLSFSAVAFIILGMSRPWSAGELPTIHRFSLLKKGASLVAGTLLATLGTLPLVMLTFNQISLIGVGTNLLAVPLIGFMAVPAGLMGMFTLGVSTFLSIACFTFAGVVLDLALFTIRSIADWPMAAWKTFTPSMIEIVLYYLLITTLLLLAPLFVSYLKGINWRVQPGPGKHIPPKFHITILLFTCMAGLVDTGYWLYQRFWRNDLRVTIIDVGAGSAAVVEFPRGPVMLIDGGGFGDNSVFDVGARVVAPYLWRRKIMTVDTVVLSHPNSDHLNGLIFIANHFRVRRLWSNGEKAQTDSYQAFKKVVSQNGIDDLPFDELSADQNINGARIQILYPPKTFDQHLITDSWRDINNNSLVIKITLEDVSFLFPGDIEKEAERELTEMRGSTLAGTVLIAPHHGSRTSSTPVFLDAVAPETVIFSCASAGRYRFPHTTVLKRYRQRGIQDYSTAQNGAIYMITNGRQIDIQPTLGQHDFTGGS